MRRGSCCGARQHLVSYKKRPVDTKRSHHGRDCCQSRSRGHVSPVNLSGEELRWRPGNRWIGGGLFGRTESASMVTASRTLNAIPFAATRPSSITGTPSGKGSGKTA